MTASTGAAGVEVVIGTDTGNQVRFVPREASVPTAADVRLTFQNLSTTQHNLTLGPPIDLSTELTVEPGESQTLAFTAPAPGAYQFVCTLHPGMEGTLTVSP